MNSFLYPALAFISKLSFGKKFTLISLLFFIPLVMLSYTVIMDAYDNIVATKNQRQGILLISAAQGVVQAVEQYRDMKLVDVYHHESDVVTATENKLREVEKSLSALKSIDSKLLNNEEVIEKLADIDKEISNAKSVGVTNASTMNVTFNALNRQVTAVNELIKMLVETSGLSRDDNAKTKSMVDYITRDIKPMSAMLGHLRSFGARALHLNFLPSAVADEFDTLIGRIYEARPAFENTTMLMIPKEQTSLHTYASQISQGVTKTLDLVDVDIVNVTAMTLKWDDYFRQVTALIDIQYQLSSDLLSVVDSSLAQRQSEEESRLMMIASSIVVVILLIVYLYAALYVSLRTSISKLIEATDRLANGDMTVTMTVATSDELGHLTEQFNRTAEKMRELIGQVSKTSLTVFDQVQSLESIADETGLAIRKQMQDTEHTATSMNEMSANFQEVAQYSNRAETAAKEAANVADKGRDRVSHSLSRIQQLADEVKTSVEVVDQLAKDSANISSVLEQIKGIAEQTNLLALNAAIEAARAGEQGRGFAVVADEVRSLSQRTHASTEEIEETIVKIQRGVQNVVSVMNRSHEMAGATVSESKQVAEALQEIQLKVETIVEMNTQIAGSVQQQASVANEIDRNLVEISRVAEQNVASAEQSSAATRSMSGNVSQMQSRLKAFKV